MQQFFRKGCFEKEGQEWVICLFQIPYLTTKTILWNAKWQIHKKLNIWRHDQVIWSSRIRIFEYWNALVGAKRLVESDGPEILSSMENVTQRSKISFHLVGVSVGPFSSVIHHEWSSSETKWRVFSRHFYSNTKVVERGTLQICRSPSQGLRSSRDERSSLQIGWRKLWCSLSNPSVR